MNAFQFNQDDIQNVLLSRFKENISDELCEEILENYIDHDDVRKAALSATESSEQIESAYNEIEKQIKHHWKDINLLLNEQ